MKPLLLLMGIMLFVFAPSLSRSVAFHYSLGSMIAVLLLAIYVVRRPKLLGSVTVGVAGAAIMGSNRFAHSGSHLAAALTIIAILIGCVAVYLYDPTSNQRLCDVVQWSLQVMALSFIVFSVSHLLSGVIIAATVGVVNALSSSFSNWNCCSRRRYGYPMSVHFFVLKGIVYSQTVQNP
jgi:NEMP family